MVRLLATIVCAFAIWQLFRLNREREVQTSKALWIPVIWLFIAASRNVSAWLQYSPDGASDQYLEGSPLDRAVLSAILALGVGVLLSRAGRVGMLLRSNLPVLLYFLYCGISVLWSDFPDVAFKRWFRALGDVVMVLIVLSYLSRSARKPAFVSVMVLAALGVAFSALFLNVGTGLVEDLGRNSTLTGRTNIWHFALGMVLNPLCGTGFESFWVGPRVAQMEMLIDQGANQAHTGYVEVFLNLGWMGIGLLAILLITAYRRILTALRWMTQVGSLQLAYFIVAVAYNFTEAGFKMTHPVWITLLLVTMVVPEVPFPEYSPPLSLDQADDLADSPQVQASEGTLRSTSYATNHT